MILLGYYDGDDPEVQGGYVDLFDKALVGDLSQNRRAMDMMRALGQIRTEESTDVLLGLLQTQPRYQETIIRSLAWQGNERSLPALRSLRQDVEAPRLKAILDAAIRYLE